MDALVPYLNLLGFFIFLFFIYYLVRTALRLQREAEKKANPSLSDRLPLYLRKPLATLITLFCVASILTLGPLFLKNNETETATLVLLQWLGIFLCFSFLYLLFRVALHMRKRAVKDGNSVPPTKPALHRKRAFITLIALFITAVILIVGPQIITGGELYSNTIEDAVAMGDTPQRIYIFDTPLSAKPVVLIDKENQTDFDGLWVVFYKTKIDWFNQTEYYVNLEIGWSASADICDNDAYPEIWFGSVSADRRDILLVNGVRPEMHDFSYQGAEYVLWITPKEEGRVPDVTF